MPGSSKTTMRRHKTADSSREVPPPRSSWTQEQRRLRREKVEAAEHPVGAASAPVGAASAPLGAPSAARGAATIRQDDGALPMFMKAADVRYCRDAFERFDKDNSGTIDTKELTALLRSMGQNPTDSEVHHMINQVDVDGSGAVEFDEFCHFMVKLMKNHDPENEVKEAYRRFDPENNGAVTVEEMRFIMSSLPVEMDALELDEMMRAADRNGDGNISFDEFSRMLGLENKG